MLFRSPVRGQLEPPDATTRPGWRYLQCTDTPNELKGLKSPIILVTIADTGPPVLLPPRASQVYAYLLSQEQVELARGAEASWERLMHVRHLKDRMISERCEHSFLSPIQLLVAGKCRRLARISPGLGKEAQFRTLYAPADFTLKVRSFCVTGPSNQIIEPNFRNSRNGTGTGMTQTTPPHRSFKRVANPTRVSTLTALGGQVEGIAAPV